MTSFAPSMARPTRRTLLQTTLAAGLASALPRARAQGSTARLVVGFPPGGAFDGIARVLAEHLRDALKQSVVVENKPGAGGRLAVETLKSAPADGSVVMLGPDALTSIYPLTSRKLTYNPKTDLVPVSTVLEFPFAFAAGSMPPAKTLAEYVRWAKAHPESANFGHPASGAPHHFFGLMLGQAIGVPMQDVPFQGSGPMMVNLMGGQISSGIEVMGGMMEYHKSGKLHVLALSSPQRMPQLPDVPTFSELGYPGITGMGFNALFAPARTPAAEIERWNRALHQVLTVPAVRDRFVEQGYALAPSTPQAAAERSAQAAAFWAPVIKASGFSMD